MLHTMAKNDITFDLNKSIKLEGDSGPYVQYAVARINSILKKISIKNDFQKNFNYKDFNEHDWNLLKKIQYFPYHLNRCAQELTAHYLTHYLLQLVSNFSTWYEKNSVQKAATEDLKQARINLLLFLKHTLKRGLFLLGIKTIEKM